MPMTKKQSVLRVNLEQCFTSKKSDNICYSITELELLIGALEGEPHTTKLRS